MCDLVKKITIADVEDFNAWKEGKLIYDYDDEYLVEVTDEIKYEKENCDDYKMYITYKEFNDWSYLPYETVEEHFITKGGDHVVAFGYVGYDD